MSAVERPAAVADLTSFHRFRRDLASSGPDGERQIPATTALARRFAELVPGLYYGWTMLCWVAACPMCGGDFWITVTLDRHAGWACNSCNAEGPSPETLAAAIAACGG